MTMLNTAPSSLSAPSIMPSTAPAEPMAPPGTASEPSQFAKILHERQNADKPIEQPPDRAAHSASTDPSAPSASAPVEPQNLQTRKTTPPPASAATASRATPKLQAAAEIELAPLLGADSETTTALKTELEPLTPEFQTPAVAAGLPEAISAQPPLSMAYAAWTPPAETATTEVDTVLTDSRSNIAPSAAPAPTLALANNDLTATAVTAANANADTFSLALDATANALAPSSAVTTQDPQSLDPQGLHPARPAPQNDGQQRSNDHPKLTLEPNAAPALNPSLMPILSDALKGLALLGQSDKPQRHLSMGVGEAGALPAWTSSSTALMPTMSEVAPTVAIPQPVHGPEFKEALATQVVMLVKDGIQQASLQLNPAHMGPISIQISLEGTQTRVDFSSDSALTRQIIEAGLPELAGALREAGLTLSGGGVSQQSSQSAQQDAATRQPNPARQPPAGADDEPSARSPTPPLTVRMNQGGLDLYA